MNYLFSDSFERVASQLCLILLVSIILDKKPHYRRLLIWEGLYGLSILLIPALRQHVVCLYEQRFLVLESIPLIAWIFCVSHCGHLLFAALPINAIMALFRTIVYVLVSPVYFLPVFNLGVTFDEILSLGQVLLVLMTFFLLKRVRFPFNTLYQNTALRLSIGSASLFVLLFYLWLRPLDPDYTEKSIWLSFSIITIILLTIFLIGVAFLVKKQ